MWKTGSVGYKKRSVKTGRDYFSTTHSKRINLTPSLSIGLSFSMSTSKVRHFLLSEVYQNMQEHCSPREWKTTLLVNQMSWLIVIEIPFLILQVLVQTNITRQEAPWEQEIYLIHLYTLSALCVSQETGKAEKRGRRKRGGKQGKEVTQINQVSFTTGKTIICEIF